MPPVEVLRVLTWVYSEASLTGSEIGSEFKLLDPWIGLVSPTFIDGGNNWKLGVLFFSTICTSVIGHVLTQCLASVPECIAWWD